MSTRLLALAVAAAGLTAAGPAAAAQTGSITATGSALVKVVPKNRKSNASIAAAVAAARKAGVAGAVRAAHSNAVSYAHAAGLTLGPIVSVTDVQNNSGYFGPFGASVPFYGPFGVDRYCGIERRPVFKTTRKDGRLTRKVIRVRKVYACIVPGYEDTTLTVTYTAT